MINFGLIPLHQLNLHDANNLRVFIESNDVTVLMLKNLRRVILNRKFISAIE